VPNIKDIHDIDKGSMKYIALDLGLKRLIPINVMGDGFNRILLFLTGLFTKFQWKLYIDDMDSGLHYDAMVDVWKGLLKINQTRPFQLFCTTHSAEMLEAAVEAFTDAPEKLRIYRLERHGEDTIAKKFDWDKANLNLLNGGELRGVHRRG
jgi:AAA15 family ATPase/GTPase